MDRFEKELTSLINTHSKENDSNTPDFLLAKFLVSCLETYNTVIKKRDRSHYGEDMEKNYRAEHHLDSPD